MDAVYEYILAVNSSGSFTHAANYLHVSQPALSIAIKKFETELNQPIFDRKMKPIKLTQAGEIIVLHIQETLLLESNTKSKLADLNNLNSGSIRLGGTQYFTSFIFPEFIKAFKETFPFVDIEIVESSSSKLMNSLHDNEIDLMFSVKELDHEQFSITPGLIDYLFISIPKCMIDSQLIKYTLTREDIIKTDYRDLKSLSTLYELDKYPFILLRDGNNLNDRSRLLFDLEGMMPKIEMNVDQLTTAHYLSRCGLGATFTTNRLIEQIEDYDELYYIKYDHPLMIRNFKIITKRGRYIPHILHEFISHFKIN